MEKKSFWQSLAAVFVMVLCSAVAPIAVAAVSAAPIVIYSDIVSGPTTGGEGGKGIYLSLFGKNFGSSGLGTTTKVFIGGAEVGSYRYLGPSKGRQDIQQITVQPGALGNPKAGVPLSIKVVVNGLASNTDRTFISNPGRILFVDNVKGNNLTAVPGDIGHPFRHVQTQRLTEGAWGAVKPGDFIVMRGTGTPWTDNGYENFFMRFRNKSGSAPTGAAGTGPIGVMGYPGENVYIYKPYNPTLEASGATGAISAINGISYPGMGQWAVISNLRIEGGGHDGAINVEIKGSNWRIVNNDLSAATAVNNINAKAGGIVGNGTGEVWLGNRIHDIYCGPAGGGPLQNHGIYIDGDGDYEIAYNLIYNIAGGSGFQIYVNGSNGSNVANNVRFHHNIVSKAAKHGINVADGSQSGIAIYNNVVSGITRAGLRFNTKNLHGARIYHNTFYDVGAVGPGALLNDWNLPADALDMQNNIFVPHFGAAYSGGSVGMSGKNGLVTRNLWYGGAGSIGFDVAPVVENPKFIEAGVNFRLRPDSPAVDKASAATLRVISNDFDISARPQGNGSDIGAFELNR